MKVDESEHPRGQPDNKGQFVKKGGRKSEEAEKIYGSDTQPNFSLSKREYAVLRKEVMRKNVAQKGKVKQINGAFTSNNFYVYSTHGGDSFVPLKQFDIEKDRDKINYWLKRLGD